MNSRLTLKSRALGVVSIIAWLLGGLPACSAASSAETRAYQALAKMFQDGIYDTAEREAGEFVRSFPESEHMAEVVLLQAQARLKQRRYDEAAALLNEKFGVAGKLGDEFRFWTAEARLQKGDLGAAADAYAQLAAEFPNSPRRAEAAFNEAFARFKVGDPARSVGLLQDTNKSFQAIARAHPDDEWVHRGWLLLAEALSRTTNNAAAEAALKALEGRKLKPELDWHRHFLSATIQLAEQHLPEALTESTNLWTTATNVISRSFQAEAAVLHGQVLEDLHQPDAAVTIYERNLADDIPQDSRRRALQKIIDIEISRSRLKELAERLEAFIGRHPQDGLLDLARLTLGELRLKDYFALKAASPAPNPEAQSAATNSLTRARVQFELLATNEPQSDLFGKSQLDRGWCLWEEGAGRLAESGQAFQSAADLLRSPADRAVARFKWADCQFLQKDWGGCVSNYWQVATNSGVLDPPLNTLPSRALYQVVRAEILANNQEGASAAMSQILARDPDSELAEHSVLLYGQYLTRAGKFQATRTLLGDFSQHFTNAVLLPQVRLALARSYEAEQSLPAAQTEYANWLAAYAELASVPTGLVAQATFDFARLSYQTQPDTNSLRLLTNFAARFPESPNTPLAQYLVGEYFFNHGDYEKAELQFQDRALLNTTNALTPNLPYHARLMAGRAAMAEQRFRNAKVQFNWIITNGPLAMPSSPIPVPIVAEAYLLRGDTFFLEDPSPDATNRLWRFGEAINAYSKITDNLPTNEFVPLAWGSIGNCNLQLATMDTNQAPLRYELAAAAYLRVISSGAAVSARSMAEVGLAEVLKKQAQLAAPPKAAELLDQASDHLLRVFYGKNLRDHEAADLTWVNKAGLAAVELAESQGKIDQAIGLYRRLEQEIPPLRAQLEKKIEKLMKSADKTAGVGAK